MRSNDHIISYHVFSHPSINHEWISVRNKLPYQPFKTACMLACITTSFATSSSAHKYLLSKTCFKVVYNTTPEQRAFHPTTLPTSHNDTIPFLILHSRTTNPLLLLRPSTRFQRLHPLHCLREAGSYFTSSAKQKQNHNAIERRKAKQSRTHQQPSNTSASPPPDSD